jgi:hypothetical protein
MEAFFQSQMIDQESVKEKTLFRSPSFESFPINLHSTTIFPQTGIDRPDFVRENFCCGPVFVTRA